MTTPSILKRFILLALVAAATAHAGRVSELPNYGGKSPAEQGVIMERHVETRACMFEAMLRMMRLGGSARESSDYSSQKCGIPYVLFMRDYARWNKDQILPLVIEMGNQEHAAALRYLSAKGQVKP